MDLYNLPIGSHVVDLDGRAGIVRNVTRHNGRIWYDVNFEGGMGGTAVRFPCDLKSATRPRTAADYARDKATA